MSRSLLQEDILTGQPEPRAAGASSGGERPTDGPSAYTAWAKTDSDGALGLSLTDHSVDVAAVAEALLSIEVVGRRLSGLAGRPLNETDVERLSFLAGLHDVGKATHAFQIRIRNGPRASHTGPVWRVLGSESGWSEVRGMLWKALGRDRWSQWFANSRGEKSHWDAVLAHHGSLPVGAGTAHCGQWEPARNGYDPLGAVAEVREMLASMFGGAFDAEAEPLPAGERFLHAWAGWVALADWLGSDRTVFGFEEDGAPTGSRRIRWSKEQAAGLVRRRFFDIGPARAAARALEADFPTLFPDHASPRPAQGALLREARPARGRIVALEAETGSGKTEAALIHFFRLFRAGEVDGLYFALPTRAAAKQIHARVRDALRRWLGDEAPPVVLAVPGYLRVDDYEGQRLPDSYGVLWGDCERDRDRGWAAENTKRYLAGAVAVGTIDQVLLGGLRVRHAQLRSGPMLRLLLCVDEVHASDAYMTTLLRNVLDQHLESGGHALLMSATLGAAARTRLLSPGQRTEPPDRADATAEPYPAIWTGAGGGPLRLESGGNSKEILVNLKDADEAYASILDEIRRATDGGAAVLFIRNRVRDCREAARRLEELGAPLMRCEGVAAPHHGRFAPEDRRLLDDALEDAFGADRCPVVAVTTQTAEQSLDICADLLVTDLAPGDVLLQRFGRLHRHPHPRPPGFEIPRAIVLAPSLARVAKTAESGLGGAFVRGGPLGLGTVYDGLVGVLATHDWLNRRGRARIPEDNRSLVEAATHPIALREYADRLGPPWSTHHAEWEAVGLAQAGVAKTACLDWNRPLTENQPDLDRQAATRLGLLDRRLEFGTPLAGPFGVPVRVLDIPGWCAPSPEEGAEVLAPSEIQHGSRAFGFRLGAQSFRYDRFGLTRAPSAAEAAGR